MMDSMLMGGRQGARLCPEHRVHTRHVCGVHGGMLKMLSEWLRDSQAWDRGRGQNVVSDAKA